MTNEFSEDALATRTDIMWKARELDRLITLSVQEEDRLRKVFSLNLYYCLLILAQSRDIRFLKKLTRTMTGANREQYTPLHNDTSFLAQLKLESIYDLVRQSSVCGRFAGSVQAAGT